MQWIQRNLFYVIWGGVAAVLTVFAFVFWYNGYQRTNELDGQLTTEKQQLEALLRADPRPSDANVKIVREDTARLEQQVGEGRKLFRAPAPVRLDAGAFRKLLDDSIHDLNRRAAASSVTVPPHFNFTFSAQRVAVTFSPGSLVRLAGRLDDVKSICKVMFDARVYAIESLRRSAAGDDEALSASPDILVAKPSTNAVTGMVRYPYEVGFTGFSRELAKVIEGFNRSPDFFIIRNIGVAAAPPPPAPAVTGQPTGAVPRPFVPAPPPVMRKPANPDDPDGEPAMTEPDPDNPDAAPAAAVRRPAFVPASSDTVLDEQLLQFTITVDLIHAPSAKP